MRSIKSGARKFISKVKNNFQLIYPLQINWGFD